MTTQLHDRVASDVPAQVLRRLSVVWRNPESRRFSPVGTLDQLDNGRFVFEYTAQAQSTDGFVPLDEYPDFGESYVSDALPVFFQNRVMSTGRVSYADYLDRLGLTGVSAEDIPMEVLVRSGGGRATDTFHIVEAPVHEGDEFSSRFFVSGIGHTEGAGVLVAALSAGDQLELRPDPANPANARAVLLDAQEGRPIGWVPDWLCEQVSELVESGVELRATVDRVNKDSPARLQVLCRIDVRPR
ncbi:HIRAN domain-containing protein [uncultured Plantibacter sp.]|uniref:HIRAN domain-containing protein n=1 Tax=uncultured Plantibacter sp. TaxID=293337 RepID=UPI0028D392E0|nr:HIRAN domain-containing protein [uncultured Plantibacter sp.]